MADAIRQERPEDVGYAIHSIPRPQSDWLLPSSPPHLSQSDESRSCRRNAGQEMFLEAG
jgi:hypothetical protein